MCFPRREIPEQLVKIFDDHLAFCCAYPYIKLHSKFDIDSYSRTAPTTHFGRSLRNGDYVGHQGHSLVENFLRDLNFDASKVRSYASPDEYEDALSRGSHNGGVTAIFDEMPYIRVFLRERCSRYSIFGPFLNTKGFGFVFPRGSSLVPDISRAILSATEMKRLIPIENKWFGDMTTCSNANRDFRSNKLTFNNFSGLFIISGVVSAVCLLLSIGIYTQKNWDKLRTVSSGCSLWGRVIVWAKHYSQPDVLRNPPPVCSCHGTSFVVAKVADSTTQGDAQGNPLASDSSLVTQTPGRTVYNSH